LLQDHVADVMNPSALVTLHVLLRDKPFVR
jgi:hypothetical protein